jgi:catechol-2,3-dioxygenase
MATGGNEMRILELSISGIDLVVLRQFYCAILGLREVEPGDRDTLVLHAGDTLLSFRQTDPGWHERYHFAFDVPSNRFDAALTWLKERRAPITGADDTTIFHSSSWNSDSVYFSDPQGNILELIARHTKTVSVPSNLPPSRPFNTSDILYISEIGLCSETVTGSAATLLSHLPGLVTYDGEGSDQFTALGDVNGLLILAHRGRIWMPDSGVAADFHPLEILLELETGRRFKISAPPYPFQVMAV